MTKTVLDLRLHQVKEIDEEIIDRNGVAWRIYAGTPATLFARLTAIQEAWPKDDSGAMVDDPDPDDLPGDFAQQTLGAIWSNLRHANPGRTFEDLQDGLLLEDGLSVLNFLSLRYQARSAEMRAELAAQRETPAPTPPPATRPSTSRKRRRASVSA